MYKALFWGLTATLLLSSCEAVDLINSVGTILKPLEENGAAATPQASASPSETPAASTASTNPTPAPAAPEQALEIVKSSDPTPVSTDWNLARLKGVTLNVSSVLNPDFAKERLLDGKLETSWFTAPSDSPELGKLPTIELSFPKPVGILSVNLRGDRERGLGLNIQELTVLINSAQGILLNETVILPQEGQDFNLVLKKPLDNASSLRLTVTRSQQSPGLAELEVLGRP